MKPVIYLLTAFTLIGGILSACSPVSQPSSGQSLPTAAISPAVPPTATATPSLDQTQAGSALSYPTLAPANTATLPPAPASSGATQPAQAGTSLAAPQCTPPASLTPALTEGPYFKAGSPERASLILPGVTGTKISITGYVLTQDCRPVVHALLDFWQANAQGQYDNSGYTLRGHLFSGPDGSYQLVTIVPGLYPGRTEHIHVKIQAPGGPTLTTQLFFPGVQQNDADSIFDPAMVMAVQKASDGSLQASFNFIVSLK